MMLAALAAYPGDLSRFGTCGAIPWDTRTVYDEPEHIPLPVAGRSWILFDLDGTLHDEMQDKSGEHVIQHYNQVIEGKHVPVAAERKPWAVRRLLGSWWIN